MEGASTPEATLLASADEERVVTPVCMDDNAEPSTSAKEQPETAEETDDQDDDDDGLQIDQDDGPLDAVLDE